MSPKCEESSPLIVQFLAEVEVSYKPGDLTVNESKLYFSAEETEQPTPVARKNSKWCWVVLAAGFLTLSVLDGVSYSFGVLLDPLVSELGVGRGGISMVGSLQTGVYSVSGLIASKLTTRYISKILRSQFYFQIISFNLKKIGHKLFLLRYGTRKICGIGNITAALGLILSSFSWDLPTLLLTYSVITGVGFGFMYIPAIVAVAEHFTQRRSLALGNNFRARIKNIYNQQYI